MANVYITGAGRGIGLELVRSHVARGDRIFALVRDPANASELADLAGSSDGAITLHRLDASDIAGIPDALTGIDDGPVDYLYNVAGVQGPRSGELENPVDWSAWDEAFDVMLKAPFAILKALLPRMHDGSKVVTFSSQLAASTWPLGGHYVYGAIKAGLNRLMRSVAVDLKAKGIIVITVHPGWVKTDMGGPNADITTQESVDGLMALADRATIDQSGNFFKWNGEPHPW